MTTCLRNCGRQRAARCPDAELTGTMGHVVCTTPAGRRGIVVGGRTWWAHLELTLLNIEPTVLRKKLEDLMNVKGIGEKSFLKLKPLLIVNQKAEPSGGAQD